MLEFETQFSPDKWLCSFEWVAGLFGGAAAPAAGTATAAGAMGWGTLLTGAMAGAQLLEGIAGYRQGQAEAGILKAERKQAQLAAEEGYRRKQRLSAAELGEIRAQSGAQGSYGESPMQVYIDSLKNAELNAVAPKPAAAYTQAGFAKQKGAFALGKGLLGATITTARKYL